MPYHNPRIMKIIEDIHKYIAKQAISEKAFQLGMEERSKIFVKKEVSIYE